MGDLEELLPELADCIMIQDLVYSNMGMTQTFLYSELQRQGEITAEVSALIFAFPSTCLFHPHRLNGKVQTDGVRFAFCSSKSIVLIIPPPPKKKKKNLTH